MQKALTTLIVALSLLFWSCAKTNHPVINDGKVALKLKECSLPGNNPVICFESLLYDSRCPEGVTCIWSGDAVVELRLRENANEHLFRLALFGSHIAGYPKDTVIGGRHIVFEELLPYPQTGEPIRKRPTVVLTIN